MPKPIKSTEELLREHDSESLMQGDLQKALGVKAPAKEIAPATTLEDFKKSFSEGVDYPIPIGWIDFDDKSGTFMRQSEEVLFSLPKTQEIENSLLAHGQTNPVKVRFNQAGKLQIIDGWTRSLLLRKNNKVSVTIKVLNITEQEAALMAGEDNFDRQEIPDFYKADYTNRLATVQLIPADKIAERFGVNKQYVYKVLAIFKFPPVLESLQKNEISLNAARRLAEVGNKLSAKDLQSLVNKTAKKEVQIQNIVREVEEGPAGGKKGSAEKKDSEGKPKQEKTLQKLPNGKHIFNKVVFDPENATLREVEALLKDVGSFRDILWSSKKDLEKKKRK